MHKLNQLSIFLTFALVASQAFSDDAPCKYTIKKSQTDRFHGEVACYSCEKMSDFAMYGAAHLVNRGTHYKSLTVKNGSNDVHVKAGSHIVSTPLSVSAGPISWNMQWNDRTHLTISTHVERGSVSGLPWREQPVSDAVAYAKCAAIPEEEKEAIKEMREKAKLDQMKQRLHQQVITNGIRPDARSIGFLTTRDTASLFITEQNNVPEFHCYAIQESGGSAQNGGDTRLVCRQVNRRRSPPGRMVGSIWTY